MAQLYWTVGPHDLVGVLEAPDDETATAFALAAAYTGSVRTTTMRAYDREAISGIIVRMGPSPRCREWLCSVVRPTCEHRMRHPG